MLEVDKSVFVDFQKIRIQETQAELPRGCIPRSLEVILRAENVETVQVKIYIYTTVQVMFVNHYGLYLQKFGLNFCYKIVLLFQKFLKCTK